MESSYDSFLEGALFKIKKQMIPCMLALLDKLDAKTQQQILNTYMSFTSDGIWGVRRVCMDRLPDFLSKLKSSDTEKLVAGLDFLIRSLQDESRWVKNQAF